jgi:hypothetical protein
MPNMFCPQCGRELELDMGQVRFCRYCGFSLTDTRESLQGYSQHKRTGFAIVAWSYTLIALVALLLHEKYLPIDTGWGYWLSALLILASVSLFVSAAVTTLRPQLFAKPKTKALDDRNRVDQNRALPQGSPGEPITEQPTRVNERIARGASVTEGTTRNLDQPK